MRPSPITRYLAAVGKTQRQFAREHGIRPNTVSAWCNGSIPRPATMLRIERVTNGEVPVTAWFSNEQAQA